MSQAVLISCRLRESNHMKSMRPPRRRRRDELADDRDDLLVYRRRRHRAQLGVEHVQLNQISCQQLSAATSLSRHRQMRSVRNWAFPVLFTLVLITLNQSISIYCKPNTSSNQQNNQQQQQQQHLQLTDKQLLRKALDSSESSRAQAIGSAINGGGESAAPTSTSTTTAASGGRAAAASAAQNSQDSSNGNQFQCPEQFGYYTDAKDCTKYYVCVFGEVLHESCTGGLRFSRELQTCDWPRNVDCPNNQTTTTTISESMTTTTAATTTAQTQPYSSSTQLSTTSTTASATSAPPTSTASSLPPATNPPNGIQDNRSKAGNGASLVFADENSDPQQPSFDEAISPVITADGAIHLHDGSGGTFALGPNPNRALASSAPQSINGPVESTQNERSQASQNERNVDVFVMPLPFGSSGQSPRSNKQQQQQQQQQSRARPQLSAANSQQPRLMPTEKQPQRAQNSRQTTSELNNRNAAAELNDESSDFNANNGASTADSTNNGANAELDSDAGNNSENDDESMADQNGGADGAAQPAPFLNDERSLQDTRASLDGNGGGVVNDGPDQDQFVPNNQNGPDFSDDTSSPANPQGNSYIPPVLSAASSNSENFNSRLFQTNPATLLSSSNGNGNGNNNNNNRPRQQQQSSPLLSVNNRQIVDPTRQTFKPVLGPPLSQHSPNAGGPRQQQSQFKPTVNSQNSNQFQRNQQSNINSNNRQNNKQQLQQLQNNNAQNNRQSRMSSQFNPLENLSSAPPPNPLLVASPNQGLSSGARFPSAGNDRQQVFSNNNHFNDSSKLTRMPTHHQQQLSNGNNNNNNNNNNRQNFPLTPSFQSRAPSPQQAQLPSAARSQNSLLFSTQRPNFGFTSRPSNPFSSSTDNEDSLANLTATSVGLFREQSLGNNGRQLNEFHQTFTGSQQNQPARRSRPPKRQQIPSGSSTTIPSGGRQRQTSGPQEFDTTTTTTTTTSTMSTPQLNRERTTLAAFNNEEADSRRQQRQFEQSGNFDQQTPPTRAQLRPASVVVPPTTVNFRDPSTSFPATNQPPLLVGSRQSRPPSGGQQTRANSIVAPGLQAGNNLSPSLDQSARLLAGGDFNQAPPTTLNSGDVSDGSGNESGEGDQFANTDSLTPTAPTTSSGSSSDGGSTSVTAQTTPDPQAVANRYLSSAIDALEAGQPFGTVDYDFDILNDNSTDRRPAGTPAQNRTSSSPMPKLRPVNRSRQRDESNLNGGAEQDGGQDQAGGTLAPPARSRGPPASGQPAAIAAQQAASMPTKKPRPTNKKIVVNHEQALANLRASVEPAKRPEPLFSTPQPNQQASKCDNRVCRLPDCKCGDTLAPGGMDPKVIPQVVLLTFDDAVNDLNWEIYEELFSGRTNPNGCPVLATFYVSHEWTDYGQVQTLYSRGHEMASHSVTHSFGEKFSKSQWFKEINGQREILNMYGGVKMNDVRGMRAPFLQIGGNKMFEMLYDANFTYDSSMPIFENSPPLWPYTLDYQLTHECMITPCPTKSYPGVWEVGMTMWVDLRGGRCSMGDACSNPTDEDGVYEMLMKNFNRHYKSNRAPFGLFYHSAWFNTVHHRRGFLRFMSTVNSLPDVFFVTNWQMLQWMRQPTPISEINSFEPWQCPAKNDRPPPCHHPSVCNVKSEHGTRFMKTCQPCPANQQYPWVGATGFKQSKQNGSG